MNPDKLTAEQKAETYYKLMVLEAKNQGRLFNHAAALTEVCFRKCVKTATFNLSDEQKECLNLCTDRFLEVSNYVERRLVKFKPTAVPPPTDKSKAQLSAN